MENNKRFDEKTIRKLLIAQMHPKLREKAFPEAQRDEGEIQDLARIFFEEVPKFRALPLRTALGLFDFIESAEAVKKEPSSCPELERFSVVYKENRYTLLRDVVCHKNKWCLSDTGEAGTDIFDFMENILGLDFVSTYLLMKLSPVVVDLPRVPLNEAFQEITPEVSKEYVESFLQTIQEKTARGVIRDAFGDYEKTKSIGSLATLCFQIASKTSADPNFDPAFRFLRALEKTGIESEKCMVLGVSKKVSDVYQFLLDKLDEEYLTDFDPNQKSRVRKLRTLAFLGNPTVCVDLTYEEGISPIERMLWQQLE